MKTKIFFSTLLLLMTTAIVWGQIPQTISYQGVLTDPNGAPVVNGNYSLTFRIYAQATGGNPLWTEMQSVAVSSGVFNVILGSVSALNLPFDQTYWLGTTIGNGVEFTPRTQLTASAYSLNARSIADGAVTGSKIASQAIDITKLNFTPITAETDPQVGANTTNYVPKWNGTALVSGTIFDNGNVGIATAAPTQKLDVDNGDLLVQGPGSFDAFGEEARVYLGDPNHYIKSVYGSGVRIGTFGASDAITISQVSGNVGIGKTNPTQKLDVNGGIAVNGRLVIDAFGNWTGPGVKTFAVCDRISCGAIGYPTPPEVCQGICGFGKVKAAVGGNCTVTSDTGSCTIDKGICGTCCVCAP